MDIYRKEIIPSFKPVCLQFNSQKELDDFILMVTLAYDYSTKTENYPISKSCSEKILKLIRDFQ